MKAPLLAYVPDADPTTPGIVTDGNGFIPTTRGLAGAPSAVNSQLEALSGVCVGAATLVRLDGATRFFAATDDKIFEAATNSWTDMTFGGGVYNTVNYRWRFAQFGNFSLAVSKENALQFSTTAGFAPITGAPKADIVETVNQFVFLFNTDDSGTFGERSHSWWCSGISNAESWAPSIATQAATGVLTSIPGKITAGRRFGDQIVVYKERGLYIGTYVGPPFIWAFAEVPSDTGTHCQESVANIGTPEQPKHFFVGREDFYVFDGSRPVPVGAGIKETFFQNLNHSRADRICMLHNRSRGIVYVFYPRGSSTNPNAAVVWNYRTGTWAVDDRAIEYAAEFTQSSITYGELGDFYPTYENFPMGLYGEAFLGGGSSQPGVFNTSHVLQLLTGGAGAGYLVSGDYGDDVSYNLLQRVKPTWIVAPSSATLECFNKKSLGDPLSIGPISAMSSGRFDVLTSARWHRVKINLMGSWEMNKFDVTMAPSGRE